MPLPEAVRQAISRSIAESLQNKFAIDRMTPLGGGCIHSAYRIEDGRQAFFVKVNAESLHGMFAAEAEGLHELRRPQCIRVPEPVATGCCEGYSWLATEYIGFVPPQLDSSILLGQQLAALHRFTDARFGWKIDNAIGSTPQANDPSADWTGFLRDHRIGFQLRLAAHHGFAGGLQRKGEKLLADLDMFFTGYRSRPSLLHGDLWGGNVAFAASGEPVLFDPAVYYGDREADIAMTELFGGFDRSFYEAYGADWPLDPGYAVRRDLYNLYHVLNHANLFGGGYAAQAEWLIDGLLAHIA